MHFYAKRCMKSHFRLTSQLWKDRKSCKTAVYSTYLYFSSTSSPFLIKAHSITLIWHLLSKIQLLQCMSTCQKPFRTSTKPNKEKRQISSQFERQMNVVLFLSTLLPNAIVLTLEILLEVVHYSVVLKYSYILFVHANIERLLWQNDNHLFKKYIKQV